MRLHWISLYFRKSVHKQYGDRVYIETFNTKISLCYSRARIADLVQKLPFRLDEWGIKV